MTTTPDPTGPEGGPRAHLGPDLKKPTADDPVDRSTADVGSFDNGGGSGALPTEKAAADPPQAAGSADLGRPSNGEILSGARQQTAFADVETIALQTVTSTSWPSARTPDDAGVGPVFGSPGMQSHSGPFAAPFAGTATTPPRPYPGPLAKFPA